MNIACNTSKTTSESSIAYVKSHRARKHKTADESAIDRLDRSPTVKKIQSSVACGGRQNALNLAISRKDKDLVERLLRKGANINSPDPTTGLYPVMVAAITGSSSQAFETILMAKPDLNVTSPPYSGLTSISHAALRADVNGVKRLLQEGASLGAPPFWEHPPYTIVAGVEDWHPHAKAFREILELLENAAKQRDDYLPISE